MKYLVMDEFDAAHQLPQYDGKCANMHGHTWAVKVLFSVLVLNIDASGIGIDFKVLKNIVHHSLPDHQLLNDILPRPSAELLAQYIALTIRRRLMSDGLETQIRLDSVGLWESKDACVIVEE
jgi:6-pyruvoyltetrahydropterin/6-carboxytetrahydropterin synthase